MQQHVAITGAGIVCSIGADCPSVLLSLRQAGREGAAPLRPAVHLTTAHRDLPVGEVGLSDAEMKRMLSLPADREISRTALLGALALRQALADAHLDPAQLSGKRVVLISGTTVGGMDVTERHFAQMVSGDVSAEYISGHDCGSNTRQIAGLCGLDCEHVTISTACSSALNAIILGARMLQAGEADIVIAGGAEALSRFHLNGFNSLMILDNEPCRPFDSRRRGLNLGEGAAYVVLERPGAPAPRLPARGCAPATRIPLAYIAGYGNRCDAYHQTATSPGGDGAALAMADALAMAGLQPAQIDYVNAHGTGTPDNDRSESAALRGVFGNMLPPVSSTKGYTGHTTSASGAIETIICLLAMQSGFVPASIGCASPDPECITPLLQSKCMDVRRVLCNSFGFGGNDSSLVLTRHIPCGGSAPVSMPQDATVAAESCVTDTADLADLREYVSPLESRRMGTLMKAALLTSLRVLKEARVERPDAIIVGTRFGMLEQGEKLLTQMATVGEEGVSPTLFMQSTHNTVAGALAIRLKCHGYNITYSQGDDTLDIALRDARRLIAERRAKTVLVGMHDFCPPLFRKFYRQAFGDAPAELYSKSFLITRAQGNG